MKYLKPIGKKFNLIIALGGLLLIDRLTKTLSLMGMLEISKNRDLFFFDVNQGWLMLWIGLILLLLLIVLIRGWQNKPKLVFFGYLLIIFGGLSNLFDRLIYGYVIDMIHLFSFSVFNLADVMIVLGCILIFDLTFLKSETTIEDIKN